jgi:RNA polymerase sigma factor (sigma-70 family)
MADSKASTHTPESILALAGSELARAIYRTANALLANTADAEEVTLDVLVALREKLGEVGEGGLEGWLQSLPAWLDRATVNKTKGRAKKHKHHSNTLSELAALTEELEANESKEKAAAMLVREVLSYLPRRHRFVFVLEYGLGHTEAAIAELTGLELANVGRTLAAVKQKLQEYAARHPLPAAMIRGMAPGVEDNPLRHYMEVYGGLDEVTEARIRRRFETWLRDDPGLELTGEHDQTFSGTHFQLDAVMAAAGDTEAEPEAETAALQDRRVGGWLFGSVASIAVIVLAVVQVQLNGRLDEISEQLSALAADAGRRSEAPEGPAQLEPGAFVKLAHDSRAESGKDAKVEMLRNDERGAEFRLIAGSLALHVKAAEGVEWFVRDGGYDISTTAARFRVIHTGSVPDVQVFDGKVEVTGGLLGATGVEVSASQYSLAAAMLVRGDVPIAERTPHVVVDPKELAALATDDVYGRALALRATDEAQAKQLLREIIDRGHDDWVTEMAFEQLRTLVDPDERLDLQVAYEQRFRDGIFAEPFAAIGCQGKETDEDRDACWSEFDETYPNSLYGP